MTMVSNSARTRRLPRGERLDGTGRQPPPRQSNSGLTLLEVILSTFLVGVVLVGALQCVGAVVRGKTSTGNQLRAQMLAEQLMSEILAAAYKEPHTTPLFGPETGEPSTNTGPRTGYDDVDDFHLWDRSPPVTRTGAVIPNLAGWRRRVTVQWVRLADPSQVSATDQGVKRVTIEVSLNDAVLATCVFLRTERYSLQ